MHLDLEHIWLLLSEAHHLANHTSVDITDADILDKTGPFKILHSLVGLVVGYVLIYEHSRGITNQVRILVHPAGWISLLDGNEFKSDGEVDKV